MSLVSWLAQFSMFLPKNSVGRGQSGLHIGTCDHFQHCHHRDLCPTSTLNPLSCLGMGAGTVGPFVFPLQCGSWMSVRGSLKAYRNQFNPQVSRCPSSPQTTTNKIANRSFLFLKPETLHHKSNKSNPLSQPETAFCLLHS